MYCLCKKNVLSDSIQTFDKEPTHIPLYISFHRQHFVFSISNLCLYFMYTTDHFLREYLFHDPADIHIFN